MTNLPASQQPAPIPEDDALYVDAKAGVLNQNADWQPTIVGLIDELRTARLEAAPRNSVILNVGCSSHRNRGGNFDFKVTGEFDIEEVADIVELVELALSPLRRIVARAALSTPLGTPGRDKP